MKITFKMRPKAKGLRAVGAAPRGFDVRVDGECVGGVAPLGGHGFQPLRGWYYAINYKGAYINTCGKPELTPEDAKAAAKAWIKAHS